MKPRPITLRLSTNFRIADNPPGTRQPSLNFTRDKKGPRIIHGTAARPSPHTPQEPEIAPGLVPCVPGPAVTALEVKRFGVPCWRNPHGVCILSIIDHRAFIAGGTIENSDISTFQTVIRAAQIGKEFSAIALTSLGFSSWLRNG